MSLEEHGYSIVPTAIPDDRLIRLRNTLFHESTVGERCLLDRDIVREVAMDLKRELSAQNHLPLDAPAIQAIAFDKTASTNWKVAWHQDLMFPFANKVSSADFDLPCIKDGVHYARPPEFVLKQLLAVRLHLDDCDETNGPLRVSPGTHNLGIMKTAAISDLLTRHGETICVAKKGEALLMRPLTLHASSQATKPKHRRVLHFVYFCGEAIPEAWHRAI